jgi:hypothetical protein
VAWWSGDSNAHDVSGNGYHATLVNGAQAGVPGLIGGAFQLNGVAAFVSTPLLLPSQGTIDLWVKPADLTQGIYGLFGTLGIVNGDDRLWLNVRGALGGFGVAPNTLVANTGSCCVNEIVVPSSLLLDTWTHIALTFDYVNDTYALYTNGSLAGISTEARTQPTQLLDFGGHRSNFGQNFYWNGLIDEVHVFNRVLTPSEILGLATSLVPFTTFTAMLDIAIGPRIDDGFALTSRFTLGAASDSIDLKQDQVTLQLTGGTASFTTTIPPGSFTADKKGRFNFKGKVDGVKLDVTLTPLGGRHYAFTAEGKHADLSGIAHPVTVMLTLGDDSGRSTVTAKRNDNHDKGEKDH